MFPTCCLDRGDSGALSGDPGRLGRMTEGQATVAGQTRNKATILHPSPDLLSIGTPMKFRPGCPVFLPDCQAWSGFLLLPLCCTTYPEGRAVCGQSGPLQHSLSRPARRRVHRSRVASPVRPNANKTLRILTRFAAVAV